MTRVERPPGEGVSARHGLAAAELAQVNLLQEICNRHEGLDLPLNLGPAPSATESAPHQFLYQSRDELVGFLSLEGGADGFEVCIAVHPDHRRRGIGRALVAAAGDVCRANGIRGWLLVCEAASASGRGFIDALGARYRFSEYRMRYEAGALPPEVPPGPPLLRRAGAGDIDFIVRLIVASFGRPEDETRKRVVRNLGTPTRRTFVARWEGASIGTLGVAEGQGCVYVVGFGVLPEHRGRGYGRRILFEAIRLLVSEGWSDIRIEVVTDNESALSLYRSSGFRETTTYGFYELTL